MLSKVHFLALTQAPINAYTDPDMVCSTAELSSRTPHPSLGGLTVVSRVELSEMGVNGTFAEYSLLSYGSLTTPIERLIERLHSFDITITNSIILFGLKC